MTKFTTSADGTQIAYDRIGTGPRAVVFVAGATQHRLVDSSTPETMRRLGNDFTAIIPDRRGRGQSGDTLPYSIDREIDDIAALISVVGGSAALFGHSSGAVLALDAAARDIGVTRLALYEPPLVSQDGASPDRDPYLVSLKERLDAGDRGGAVALFMSVTGMPAEAIQGMRHSPAWPALEAIAPTLAYDGTVMAEAESGPWAARWAAVTVPTLIVNGDASFDIMEPAAAGLAVALSNATRVTLAGQDHSPNPEVLAPVLRDFLLG
jgi:pimeloyl-ACP methyl ester carboxylesterase